MLIHTLASGSSGNAVLIQSGDSAVLIDAGISCRKITQRLKAVGLTVEALSGILITHEHSDHICGLPVLLKYHPVPVYASTGTCAAIADKYPAVREHLMAFPAGSYFELGALTVTSFSTPHDAADSVGYLVSDGEKTAAVLTDLGQVPDYIAELASHADAAILEANHDVDMLRRGPYPYPLQERVLGGFGHLCNEAAAALAVHLALSGTKALVLAHLSRENNTPELARFAVEKALNQHDLHPLLTVAPRDELSEKILV